MCEPGRKEPAACARWWAGWGQCGCIPECSAHGLKLLCLVDQALHSFLPSSMLLVQQCPHTLLVAEKCSVFIIAPVSVQSVLPMSWHQGKEKQNTFSLSPALLSPRQAERVSRVPPSLWLAEVF